MHSFIQQSKALALNVKRVMKLAFEIDRRLVILYYLTSAAGAIAPIGVAFLFKIAVDQIVANTGSTTATTVPIVIVLAFAGYFLMGLLELVVYWGLNVTYYDYLLRNRFQSGLTLRFSRKLSQLDVAHLEDPETQNLIAKVDNTFQWQIPDFVRIWNYFFGDVVGIVIATLALLPFGWWMPLIVISVSLPRIYLKAKHGKFAWSMFGSGAPSLKKLWYTTNLLKEPKSILETRIFGSQEALLQRMSDLHEHMYHINKKPLDKYRWVVVVAPIVESIVVFAIVIAVMPQALSGALSIGTITFIVTMLANLSRSTARFAAHVGELHQFGLFVGPYFELMDLPKLIKEKTHPQVFTDITPPRIEFKHVSFAYPKGHAVLKDVSFVVEPGESLALVGVNGAGKTTIIKLLCRFYDVTSGEILINGVNIKDLELKNWYKHLATLFQDFVQYNFTVRDNIMLGAPEVNDEQRMRDAAKKADAAGFIEQFAKGYDQMLGRQFEDGEELSGGQWQKLAIARALYQQAPVLIMDEPTSAIDAQAEYEIFQNLEQVYTGKTLILVSHRFSTVRNANKIVVIKGGKIAEIGTHEELLAANSHYAKMFTTQAKGYK